MKSLGQLKRRKFIRLRSGRADVAVGVLAAIVVELNATAAHAQNVDLARLDAAGGDASTQPTIDLDAIRSLSVEELKALFTPEQLKALGIDAGEFAKLLDVDVAAAIKMLDAAFHKHVDAVAATNSTLAAAKSLAAGSDDRDAAVAEEGEGLGGGISPLLILGGLAVVGGGIALAASGGSKPATATADAVTTAEDTSITFDPRTNDTAGKGALTITKINGTDIAVNGSVAITGGSLKLNADGTLSFTPTANFNGTPSFNYTVVDAKGSAATATVNLTVTAVNDAPTAANVTATTAEDTAVKIDPRTSATDADGDTLTVTAINGTAITATSPVATANGTVSLNADGTLTFTPKADFNGAPSFSYTLSDGKGGTVTATANITVTAVNDAPVNTVPTALEGAANTAVLVGGLSIADVDAGTATFSTTLTVSAGSLAVAAVNGGAAVTGTGTGTVVLTGTIDQVNASLKAVSFTGGTGNATLTVTTSDGTKTDTDSFPITIAQVQTGVVIDGYVKDAQVFVDVNGNGKQDPGEPFGKTNGNGEFMIVGNAKGPIVAFGGVNTDTGLPNKLVLSTPLGATVVSPLSTIVQSLIAQGESPANAKALVAELMGLPLGVDLTNYDPLAPGADPALALEVQKGLATIAAVMTAAYDAGGTDAVSALVGKLSAAADAGVAVDFTDLDTLVDLLTGLPGISADEVMGAALVATAAAQAIDAATSLGDIVQAMKDTLTPGADLPVVTQADVVETQVEADFVDGKVTFNTFAAVNVLANDIDAEKTMLTLVSINGVDISKNNGVVQFDNYTVTALPTGEIKIESNDPAFAGSYSFEYVVADAAGNLTTETVTVNVAPFGSSIGTDAEDLPAIVASTGDLIAAGVTTVDLTADAGTITEAQAATLIDAGLTFAADDVVSVQADGTHMSTTLKGLTDLNVASVIAPEGATVLSIAAGAGLDGLNVAGLPQFDVAQSDAALDVTLNVDGALDAALDLGAIAGALGAAGIDHIGNGSGALNVTLAQAGQIATGGLDFAASSDVSVLVGADGLATLNAGQLGAMNVDHLDIIGDAGSISDAQAQAIVNAGLDFALADDVTVQADGTTMSTSLKSLQQLNVDAVAVNVGIGALAVDAGFGGLGALSAAGLPQFDVAQSDAALDVTLNVASIDASLDLTNLVPALNAAGVDHIGSTGDTLTVTVAQANQVAAGGLDFAAADDIAVSVNSDALGGLNAAALAAVNVDIVDLVTNTTTISEGKAAQLIDAGLEFAADDVVSVEAAGTHMGTSLQSLQDLGVSAIVTQGQALHLSAGEGGLSGLSTADLPQINPGQEPSMLDVTLDIGGAIDPNADLGPLAQGLSSAGVDYLSAIGPVGITGAQYNALNQADLGFTQGSNVTLTIAESAFGASTAEATRLHELGVDHIDIAGDSLSLSDAEASNLVAAGIDFAISDAITVEASGTHMSTTLQGLHDLNVDSVMVGAEGKLVLAAGSLADLTTDTVPSFVEAQSDAAADITLVVGASDLADLLRLGTALNTAGIDHFAFNGVVTPELQSQFDAISATSGINFVPFADGQPTDALAISQAYDFAKAADSVLEPMYFGDLLKELSETSDLGGTLDVTDATAASLLESGMLSAYLADTLVIDATDSGDKLYSTLKSLADVGADSVLLSHQDGSPVYISLGLEGSAVTADDVAELLNALSDNGTFEKIFDGADNVSLVIDESAAQALSGVDGAMQHLADLGFTEVDVLDTTGSLPVLPADPAIEVKVIGQDNELYDYLHNPK